MEMQGDLRCVLAFGLAIGAEGCHVHVVMRNRRRAAELMDQRSPDPARLEESLSDLAWLNRRLGGTSAVVGQAGHLLRGYGRGELSVLDVGAGGGDILVALGEWCASRRLSMRAVGLDRAIETIRIGRRRLGGTGWRERVGWVVGDARDLPFPERAFDIAISSTTLHHLDPTDAVRALEEMARVSDWGLVVSDLRRSLLGYASAWLLAKTLWRRHEYTRHDGPASMRAAYTATEARELGAAAGLAADVVARPPFRWVLRWRRGG